MFRRATALILVAAVGIAVIAVSVGGDVRAQALGTLRVPLGGEPPTMDPYFSTDFSSGDLAYLINTTLVSFDAQSRIIPQAAKNWTVSPNGLVYTFTLRDNVKFHSGRAVQAADWKWSFERMGDPTLKTSIADVVLSGIQGYDAQQNGGTGIAGIRVIDPLTLQFVLNANARGGFLNQIGLLRGRRAGQGRH